MTPDSKTAMDYFYLLPLNFIIIIITTTTTTTTPIILAVFLGILSFSSFLVI